MMLASCSGTAPPPPPTSAELPSLVSQVQGYGPHGYDVYDVNLIRFVPQKDWAAMLAKCLNDSGVLFVGPGPYVYANDQQGSDAMSAAFSACSLEYPSKSILARVHTKAQWNYEYDYLDNEFTACVLAAGDLMDSLPDRKTFIVQSMTTPRGPSGYDDVVPGRSGIPISLLKMRCPADAPGF